jgi:hypothetical protein
MILGIGCSSADTVSSISGGGTWSKVVSQSYATSGVPCEMWAANCTSSVSSVTVTVSGSNFCFVEYHEFSGATTTTDGTSSGAANSTTPSSGNIATTNASDLIIGFYNGSVAISSFESGWTGDPSNNSGEYKIVTSTGTYASTFTLASANDWAVVAAAFKATSGSSYSTAFSSNVHSGNLLIAGLNVSSSSVYSTPTDTQGNTWTSLMSYTTSDGSIYQTWYAFAGSSAANTVTVNFTAVSSYAGSLLVAEYSGVKNVSPVDSSEVDGFAAVTPGTTSISTPALTTILNNDLLIAHGRANGGPITALGTGWSQRYTDTNYVCFADQVASTAGSYSFSVTQTSTSGYTFQAIGTKAATTTIALAQNNPGTNQSGAASLSTSFNLAVKAGNSIVVAVLANGTASVSSVTDTLGNVYTKLLALNTNATPVEIWWSGCVNPGSCVVNAALSAAVGGVLEVYEFAGIDATDGAGAIQYQTGVTSTSSGNLTTTNANDLLFGVCNNSIGPSSAGTSGWNVESTFKAAEYNIVGSTGSYPATFTLTSSGNATTGIFAFKAGNFARLVASMAGKGQIQPSSNIFITRGLTNSHTPSAKGSMTPTLSVIRNLVARFAGKATVLNDSLLLERIFSHLTFHGVGTLTPSLFITRGLTERFNGKGTLTPNLLRLPGLTELLKGQGTLTAVLANSIYHFTETIQGSGSLSSSLTVIHPIASPGAITVTSHLPAQASVASTQTNPTTSSSVPQPTTTSFQTQSGLVVISRLDSVVLQQ